MGWDLLLNESRFIERQGQRIAILGVENWGSGGFKKAGDLNKALSNVAAEDFKILPSFKPLRLFALSVVPEDVMSVMISD